MNCRQVDPLICDYLDGTLDFEARRQLEDHTAHCESCSAQLADAELALRFMNEVPKIEPPVELVADIIHETIGVHGTLPALAGGGAEGGSGFFGSLRPFFHPFLQPRFAMSLAMALLSFSMLTFYSHGALQKLRSVEGDPLAVVRDAGEGVERIWTQTVQLYETLRAFYELQATVEQQEEPAAHGAGTREATEDEAASGGAEAAPAPPSPDRPPPEEP